MNDKKGKEMRVIIMKCDNCGYESVDDSAELFFRIDDSGKDLCIDCLTAKIKTGVFSFKLTEAMDVRGTTLPIQDMLRE